jgi:NTP pyrophosphatase (non-canonical NTP hydrolase)
MTRIRSKIDKAELLAGIAEESGELTQAALKLRRTIDGRNLTPVSRADAEAAYIEELAYELLSAWAYGIDASKVASVMDRKIKRWDNRLGEGDTDDIL